MTRRRTCQAAPLAATAALALLAGCATVATGPEPHLVLAPEVDLSRYAGTWYIVAEIPYSGERGYVGSRAVWTPLPDGRIDDRYLAYEKSFDGKPVDKDFKDRIVPGSHNAEWRVPIFFPITVDMPILYVSPDYRISLVGWPYKTLGWIFSRSPDMDEATYRAMLAKFAAQGYDVSKFRRMPQTPAQIGAPGFS